MRHSKIPLANTKAFSPFFLDYIQQKETLQGFYDTYPRLENFNKPLTKEKDSFPSESREVLNKVLQNQYKSLVQPEKVKQNIEALKSPETFTVTTGHQLNIFTGPLYFIYKIITVINTCRDLQKKYPNSRFVPVYWMASEDHDYDEIKYFRLYGEKYVWETSQTGAVGRFHTKELKHLVDVIPGEISIFRNAYLKHEKLSDAVRYYVNELFGAEGVVVLDPDDKNLKSLFKNVIREDIVENKTIALVEKTNKELENLGYKTQIFCRDINFFYLDNNIRNRIEKVGNKFQVVDTELSFTGDQLKELIEKQPEKFSPNVILRPLYQEMILPNIAYVGGPAEVIYWLQLKNVFDHFKTPFPVLMPRNFAMVVDHTISRKFDKTGLTYNDLFEDKNYIFNHWVLKNTNHDITVGTERAQIEKHFRDLEGKASAIDKTLGPFVAAEGKRTLNNLERIERKLLRAEKRLHADRLRQIEEVKDALFPNGGLQERTDNFLNFYQQDKEFIQKLINHFDPFDFKFNVLSYTSA
jgi:bacillithiol biosynthesis cysteine-adding enzyme BshC